MITENLVENGMGEVSPQNLYNIFQDVHQFLKVAGVKQEGSKEQYELGCSLIEEEFEELCEAYLKNDAQGQADAVADLLVVVLNYAYMFNIDAEAISKRVSKSNWSKFCTTLEEARNTVAAYASGTHPNKPGAKISCWVDEVGEYFIVKRLSDNKIMKSINFVEP